MGDIELDAIQLNRIEKKCLHFYSMDVHRRNDKELHFETTDLEKKVDAKTEALKNTQNFLLLKLFR